jgi:hypothetical protein
MRRLLKAAVTLVVLGGAPSTFAQSPNKALIDVPGLGSVDLNELPPALRANIRLPGRGYVEPDPKPSGLQLPPPEPEPEDDRPRPDLSTGKLRAGLPISTESLQPRTERPRDEVGKAMRKQWEDASGEIPEDAYLKALEHINSMPDDTAPPPEPDEREPQSLLSVAGRWLARLGEALSTRHVVAQSAQWQPIGPAPLQLSDGSRWAGIVVSIAGDPQDATHNRFYLGTVYGGVWRTSDGGTTWDTTTDSAPSLQTTTVAVHPTNRDVVVAGTGTLPEPLRSVGILRTTSATGLATWSQIGPTCTTTDAQCMSGGVCSASDPNLCLTAR